MDAPGYDNDAVENEPNEAPPVPKTPRDQFGAQNSLLHAAGPGWHCWVLPFGGLTRSSRVDCVVGGIGRGGKAEGKSGWLVRG